MQILLSSWVDVITRGIIKFGMCCIISWVLIVVYTCIHIFNFRKGANKTEKMKADLLAMRITGIGRGRPIVPLSLYTAMEPSTLVQGSGDIVDEDMACMPDYVKDIKTNVFEQQ